MAWGMLAGLGSGAGNAVRGLAQILTHDIATLHVDVTPTKKNKALKADSKMGMDIKLSPLTLFLALDIMQYSRTGEWHFTALETVLGAPAEALSNEVEGFMDNRDEIAQYTDSPTPLLTWAMYTPTMRERIVRAHVRLVASRDDSYSRAAQMAQQRREDLRVIYLNGAKKDQARLDLLHSDPKRFFEDKYNMMNYGLPEEQQHAGAAAIAETTTPAVTAGAGMGGGPLVVSPGFTTSEELASRHWKQLKGLWPF